MKPSLEISYLLTRYLEGELTEQEQIELYDLLQRHPEDEYWTPYLQQIGLQQEKDAAYDPARWQAMVQAISRHPGLQDTSRSNTGRVHILRRWWWAAAILLLVAGAGLLLRQPTHTRAIARMAVQPVAPVNDALPGGNKAVLTLAGGQQIVLDSTRDGELARQNNALIKKTGDGALVYMPATGGSAATVAFNTLSTPRGGLYTLTLPDGTKVWLNAASAITYPTAFNGGDRSVKISGEVYLEVAKNEAQPFKVSLPDGEQIEVLGTSFNINSYADEPSVSTTLVEGAVRVVPASAGQASVVLRPGQQAVTIPAKTADALHIIDAADMEKVLAWKNGYFQFDNASLEEVLRQLSRWYDLDVIYTGEKTDRHYKGKIPRNLKASDMLRIIDASGIHFKITGKKIEVS